MNEPLPADDPPELQGLSAEQRRFYRLIEERSPSDAGTEVLLACGHRYTLPVPLPDWQQYLRCANCIYDWKVNLP